MADFHVYKEFDKSWNEFFDDSPYGDILGYWQWGEVKKNEGWQPHRVALLDNNKIIIAAQILIKPAGPLGNLAYIPHGPVFRHKDKLREHFAQFISHLRAFVSDYNCFAIEIEPKLGDHIEGELTTNLKPFVDNDALNVFVNAGFQRTGRNMQPKYKLLYDLELSEDELLGLMKKNTRYNVRYAAKHGVQVDEYLPDHKQTPEKLQVFYKLLQEVQERSGGYPIRPYSSFEKLINEFKGTNNLGLFETSFEGDTIAINISERTGYWSSSFYAGSNRLHAKLKAPYLLRWESVVAAKNYGCKVYDFWGIIPGSDQHKGYSDTKLSFGGVRIDHVGILAMPVKQVQFMIWDQLVPLRTKVFAFLRSLK